MNYGGGSNPKGPRIEQILGSAGLKLEGSNPKGGGQILRNIPDVIFRAMAKNPGTRCVAGRHWMGRFRAYSARNPREVVMQSHSSEAAISVFLWLRAISVFL